VSARSLDVTAVICGPRQWKRKLSDATKPAVTLIPRGARGS
jgi:hypothetical protein